MPVGLVSLEDALTRKEQVAADIEQRIAQRDRLWANAQGTREANGLDVIEDTIAAATNARLATRVEILESGLARFLDPEWVATASIAEMIGHAREVLRLRPGTPTASTTAISPTNAAPAVPARGWHRMSKR